MTAYYRALVCAVVLSLGACSQAPSPQLGPQHAESQRTLDRIARARSAVRWFAAVRTTLQAFGASERALYDAGRIDDTTHARLEEWISIVQEDGIAALTAIERAAQRTQEDGTPFALSAESVRDLAARVAALSVRVATVGDASGYAHLVALLESVSSTLRLVLQILDPDGAVALADAAMVVSPPPGVPRVTLRIVGPRQAPIPGANQ